MNISGIKPTREFYEFRVSNINTTIKEINEFVDEKCKKDNIRITASYLSDDERDWIYEYEPIPVESKPQMDWTDNDDFGEYFTVYKGKCYIIEDWDVEIFRHRHKKEVVGNHRFYVNTYDWGEVILDDDVDTIDKAKIYVENKLREL